MTAIRKFKKLVDEIFGDDASKIDVSTGEKNRVTGAIAEVRCIEFTENFRDRLQQRRLR